jgi:hypothetical protein
MTKTTLAAAVLLAAVAAPAAAQLPGRHLSVEPFATYGFYGKLPETSARLEGDWGLGARASLRVLPRFALFVTAQRSTPRVLGQLGFGDVASGGNLTVDSWSAGLEYSRFPSGGVEGILPLVLSAGLGQVSYEDGPTDLAANLGIATGMQIGSNFALRYGFTDYVSRFDGDRGWVNQYFLRVGGELSI